MPSLFDKVAKDLQDSFLTLSEKAGEWLKTGTEALRGGMEMASAKAAHASKLAKLKWEQNVLQREIEKAFTALGGHAYELFAAGQLQELGNAAKERFEQLQDLEKKLEEKEQENEHISRSFTPAPGTSSDLKDLRKDLEDVGGTIMQFTVTPQSALAHKACREVAFSQDLMIGAILRADELIIPAQDTILMPGDRVTLLGKKEAVQQAAQRLVG
ncbi:MAG: TrkA C-terminal domain-containing protein [bacterium]